MSVIKAATMKTKASIALLCLLCSTHYTAVRVKKYLKNTSVIKVATMKNTVDFSLCKGSHQMQPPLFTVSKDEWNTKEDTGKSLKNALDVLWYLGLK